MATAAQRERGNHKPVIAIDVGGTKILAAVVTPRGEVLSRVRRKTRADRGSAIVIERIAQTGLEALDEAGLLISDVDAVGVGVPGAVNGETGVVSVAPNLGWNNTPVGELLARQFKSLPVFLGNDCDCCTLGEYYFGVAQGLRDVVGVFVGTGIGGGIIIDGKLHVGRSHAAGEVGHMIIQIGGPKLAKGFRGSLEAMGGRLAIVREIEEAMKAGKKTMLADLLESDDPRGVRSKMLARAYQSGDKVVVKAIEKSAHAVGVGVAAIAQCLSPEMIVVGGGVVDALGQPYVKMVNDVAREHLFPVISRNLKIVRSRLGDDVGILGDAAMVGLRLGWPLGKEAPGKK